MWATVGREGNRERARERERERDRERIPKCRRVGKQLRRSREIYILAALIQENRSTVAHSLQRPGHRGIELEFIKNFFSIIQKILI